MSAPAKVKTNSLLQPLAWIYGEVMKARNERFDTGRAKVESFGVPVISVGNLSVGGTGKTPMSGYLLRLLLQLGASPVLLSRGYGRKTKGYRVATAQSTAAEVGDEPLEIYKMFQGNVPVRVCEKRCEGAHRLLQDCEGVGAIVLDDAYQHRFIHRDLNILLTDYNRLYTRDKVLPAGRLRETAQGAERANIIVVTKCPSDLTSAEAELVIKELNPRIDQPVFFTAIRYAEPAIEDLANKRILIMTGIAKPEPLIEFYKSMCPNVETLQFPDHHAFSKSDIAKIEALTTQSDIVVTTSKDFQRLPQDLPAQIKDKLAVQEISVEFLLNQGTQFDNLITSAINHFNAK